MSMGVICHTGPAVMLRISVLIKDGVEAAVAISFFATSSGMGGFIFSCWP